MKTTTKATFTVDTWLPVFSGFYGTIWETDSDEEMEIENINDERRANGLSTPIEWDDIEWDYEGYTKHVAEGMTGEVELALKSMGLVESCKMERIVSPREYNFANDSVNVTFTLSAENVTAIKAYLRENREAFAKYIKGRYTSYDGFISFHSNNPDVWIAEIDQALTHKHKLASILHFILLNEDNDAEMTMYDRLHGNGCFITAANYGELLKKI